MNKINLYNDKGELCIEAQKLLPTWLELGISKAKWRNDMRDFENQLSIEDLKEFKRLRARAADTKYRARYFEKNREKVLKYHYDYNSKNPEKKKNYDARWYAKNLNKKVNPKTRSARHKRKMESDPMYAITTKLRAVVRASFKRIGKNKPTNTQDCLGCNWEEAKTHIESLWQEGMTWDNHSLRGWHIDHIRPVSSFEHHELHLMNHISNLQPLWAEDNLKKSDTWKCNIDVKGL